MELDWLEERNPKIVLALKSSKNVDLDLRNVLLLDNQSTFDLCCNKKFTSQITKATNALTMTSNGGGLRITEKSPRGRRRCLSGPGHAGASYQERMMRDNDDNDEDDDDWDIIRRSSPSPAVALSPPPPTNTLDSPSFPCRGGREGRQRVGEGVGKEGGGKGGEANDGFEVDATTIQRRRTSPAFGMRRLLPTTTTFMKTSEAVQQSGGDGSTQPVTFGEMIRFLGIRLLMSTQQGWSTDDYWFWEIRQMIKEWNTHMTNVFLAAWVICLDESMSIWHQREFSGNGKTGGLLMRVLRPYFYTGRYVAMQSYFDGMNVGDCDAIQGVMEGTTYNLWGMKEPDYVMRMMATGGPLDANDSCRTASRRWNEAGDSWKTQRWETRVFSFILAITEVNAFLCLRYFTFGRDPSRMPHLLAFRRRLAWQMIKNSWIMSEEEREDEVRIPSLHQLMTAPPHAKHYRNRQWNTTAESKYQQYMCRNHCGKR
ncbi:hypothetical protein ACHAW5_006750 [Stephanodiscus triporus]|uniref:PiggyBac transposable element-derived protein domain-containing protein n=1 Tax=Stephanodiscus triporus TaxID=2934178 RepID=A0ABD3NZE6_9STRA